MATAKRRVEVFTARCPICEEVVRLVTSLACPRCDVHVYDLREGWPTNECREKAARYGISALPAIAVDGNLLDCCRRIQIEESALRAVYRP
jgi:hypothetical protein